MERFQVWYAFEERFCEDRIDSVEAEVAQAREAQLVEVGAGFGGERKGGVGDGQVFQDIASFEVENTVVDRAQVQAEEHERAKVACDAGGDHLEVAGAEFGVREGRIVGKYSALYGEGFEARVRAVGGV